MTCKYGVRLGRLAVPISLFLSVGCGFNNQTPTSGSAGTTGESGSSGSSGAPGGTGGGASGSGAGTGGASGMSGLNDGGTAGGGIDAGGNDGGAFACPTLPVPGNCAPPADLRCPYPKISQTGCLDATPFSDSTIPIKMASVVVPYEVNSPLWSDGAYKTRGMRLPTGGKIHVKDCVNNPTECCVLDPVTLAGCLPPADDGKWVLPAGTVMVKSFMFPDASRPSGYKVVETRLFVHLAQPQEFQGMKTEWIGYSYQWDDAQTDATIIGTLVAGSDTGVSATFQVKPAMGATAQPLTWNYPSRTDCVTCHTAITPTTTPVSGFTLGPETRQMNRVAAGDTMNQIDKFANMGMFETAPAKPYLAALVAPYMGQSGSPPAGATLDQRARSYLHANCSFCHRPDGTWSGFDVRFDVPLKSAAICNAVPGAKGSDTMFPGATLLTPGQPMDSVIWLRMHAQPGTAMNATGRMPALASVVVDTQATDLISQWITSINSCPM
jgi:hypothetical protein